MITFYVNQTATNVRPTRCPCSQFPCIIKLHVWTPSGPSSGRIEAEEMFKTLGCIEFNNCPTRCDLFSLLYFCRHIYMFRVLTPIIRSSYSCNYSFWYWLTAVFGSPKLYFRTVQQDATYSVYYISVGSSTCFGCWHPPTGARTAVITASGID